MSGSKTKKSGTFFHSKRAYLFGLLTIVLFLGLNFFFPGSKPQTQTSVSIEFSDDGSEPSKHSTQQALLDELKTQLSVETLAQTLDTVRAKTEISSQLFELTSDSQFDVESIRAKLIAGALSVERLTPAHSSVAHSDSRNPNLTEDRQTGGTPDNHEHTSDPNQALNSNTEIPVPKGVAGFQLSILGNGTNDELLFVKLLAKKIKDSVSPDYDRDQIKSEIESIRDGMITSSKMNKTLRDSVSATFEKYTRRQEQLLASASVSRPESDELLKMRKIQEQCVQAYRINANKEFEGKADVQARLDKQINFLTQEIQRQSEKERSQNQRLAKKDTGVERATFVDGGVSGIQPFELEQEVSSLKTDVALLVGKIDIAAKQQSDNLEISSKLTQILERGAESTVHVSEPRQTPIWGSPKSLMWIGLASVAISGMIVFRIRTVAFANHFADQSSIEESLQLPVIDQISLPTSTEKEETKIIVQQTRWVRMLTKTCEVVLLVGLVGIISLLLVQNDSAKQLLFHPTSFFQ